jgi:hypothetical protein
MRGLILGLAVGLAVLLTSGEGRADFLTGQMLNKECRDGERDDQDSLIAFGQCHGYIQGVYDAGKVLDTATDKRQWNGGWTACVPDGVPMGQLKEVVKKWLREHPADWHYTADNLVARAFEDAFPCR